MSKTIGLTFDLKTDYIFKPDDPKDANAEFDNPSTIEVIAQTIESLGYKVKRIGNVRNLIDNFDNLGVDIVFNISEGLCGRNRESQVPIILEMKGIPYVGSDGLTLGLTLDKIMAKKVFIAEGIPTPKFFEAKDAGDVINFDHLKFPVIVKPRFEGSSKGIDENAFIRDQEELIKRLRYVINTYKQPALVEEFIAGFEFTLAIIGNDAFLEVFPPVQIKIDGRLKLGERFYTFAHISSERLEYVCPAPISSALDRRLRDLAKRAYEAVECRDFGRIDFRVDEKGNPFCLEINPLPSLSTEDVFSLLAKVGGITYAQMLNKILTSTFRRYNL